MSGNEKSPSGNLVTRIVQLILHLFDMHLILLSATSDAERLPTSQNPRSVALRNSSRTNTMKAVEVSSHFATHPESPTPLRNNAWHAGDARKLGIFIYCGRHSPALACLIALSRIRVRPPQDLEPNGD